MHCESKSDRIDALLANDILIADLELLRQEVNEQDLSIIIQRIYDLNKKQVNKIAALQGVMARVDALKNSQRNNRFIKKVSGNFRVKGGTNKVIVAEGDSWFNYPVLLSDVIDWITMEDNLAVYSLASGGDWLLNMLSARKYVEQLSTLHPDVFLISGGGNDLVGRNRMAAMVDPDGKSNEFGNSAWAQRLIDNARANPTVALDEERFTKGVRLISKDFFALLMFFHLQYYFLINGILTGGSGKPEKGKFPGIRIITQGYDYALSSNKKGWGLNPLRWYKPFARLFLGHGTWLKTPLSLRGIYDIEAQRNVVYAMIYIFNEMMIETGGIFCKLMGSPCVCHIDSRGSVGEDGWTDELHPLPAHFRNTGRTFIHCINDPEPKSPVYVVNKLYPFKP